MFSKRFGQSLTEYVILIGIVSAAFLAMNVYMKRGIQGVIKVASDEIGRQEDAEEIDPQKGTRTASDIRRVTSGATAGSAELSEGATRRIRTFEGGSQRTDVYTASEVKPLINCDENGNCQSRSTYTSRKEE